MLASATLILKRHLTLLYPFKGIGKKDFLRRLAKKSKRFVVYFQGPNYRFPRGYCVQSKEKVANREKSRFDRRLVV